MEQKKRRLGTKLHILIDLSAGLFAALILATACRQQQIKSEEPSTHVLGSQVKLPSQALDSANLEIITINPRYNETKIVTTGEIKADDNRVFHINSKVPGTVIKDNVVLGKAIKLNEELAIIQSLDVARTYGEYIHESHQNEIDIAQAQARYDLAKKNVQRLEKLNKEGIVAEKDLLQAQNQEQLCQINLGGFKEHRIHMRAEAKSLLAAYGVSLDKEEKKGTAVVTSESPLLSPRPGVIIKKTITVGDVVNPAELLYVVADLSQVWLDIAIYDKDLEKIKEGEPVVFRSDSIPGKVFQGKITYIQPAAGDATKTFSARVVLPNPGFVLKPGMFGQVEITCSDHSTYPYLPDRALQKYANENFVFIRDQQGSFKKQKVVLGDRLDDGYLANEGVKVGDQVVGAGSFKLKSELLKSEIGNEEQ